MKSIKLMLLGVLIMQAGACLLIIFSLNTPPLPGFEWAFFVALLGLIVGIVGYRSKDTPAPPQAQPSPPAQPDAQISATQPAKTERSSPPEHS